MDHVAANKRDGVPVTSKARGDKPYGHLTEELWAQTGAVQLADISDRSAFSSAVAGLLSGEHSRRAVGQRGYQIYIERFSVRRVVEALRVA